jgi:hypothetical protein
MATGTFPAFQSHVLSANWIAAEILPAPVNRPATMRGQPRGASVQSLILLDFRTVVVCAALIATSEVVLAREAPAAGGSTVTVSCSSPAGERQRNTISGLRREPLCDGEIQKPTLVKTR